MGHGVDLVLDLGFIAGIEDMDGDHAVGNIDIGNRAAWLQVIQRYGQG